MNKATVRQYMAAFSCQLCAMMVGSTFVWFTPLLESLKAEGSRVPMTDVESSWMISLIEVGELFSPIPAGILLNRVGRKAVLLSTFPLIACSWILILSTYTVEALYAARLLQGLAMGIAFTVGPVYLAEIADAKIRGVICGNFQTLWSSGILYSYVTGPFMSYEAYAYASAAVAVLFGFTFFWVPESPYYLIMKDRCTEAREVLIYFRGTEDVDEELLSIKNSFKPYGKTEAKWRDLIATEKDRKNLLVVSSIAFVKYMSGVAAVTTYITETFSRSVGGTFNKNYITIVTGSVMLLATIVSAYVCDLIGRRPLIFISCIGCIIALTTAGVYFLLFQLKVDGIENYSWVAYISIGFYCIINNLGLSPLLQTLQAECFSSEIRGLASGFISFFGTILLFISLKQYQPLEESVGVYMNYFLFSIYSIIGSIAIMKFMKETAGKTLVQIQENDDKLLNQNISSTDQEIIFK